MVLIFRTDSSDMTNARTKVGDDQEEEEEGEKEKRCTWAATEEGETLWKGRIRM